MIDTAARIVELNIEAEELEAQLLATADTAKQRRLALMIESRPARDRRAEGRQCEGIGGSVSRETTGASSASGSLGDFFPAYQRR